MHSRCLPIDGRHGGRNRLSRTRLDRLLLIVHAARAGWSAVALHGTQRAQRLPRKRHRAPERGEGLVLDRVEHGARDNQRAATLPPRGRVGEGQNANLWRARVQNAKQNADSEKLNAGHRAWHDERVATNRVLGRYKHAAAAAVVVGDAKRRLERIGRSALGGGAGGRGCRCRRCSGSLHRRWRSAAEGAHMPVWSQQSNAARTYWNHERN
jgi:hypothetical protein